VNSFANGEFIFFTAALEELGNPSESTVGQSAAEAAAATAAQADKFEGDEDTEAVSRSRIATLLVSVLVVRRLLVPC